VVCQPFPLRPTTQRYIIHKIAQDGKSTPLGFIFSRHEPSTLTRPCRPFAITFIATDLMRPTAATYTMEDPGMGQHDVNLIFKHRRHGFTI